MSITQVNIPRPDHVTEEHLVFLDELREEGEINMMGGASYLMKEFFIPRKDAREILTYWLFSFGKDER